MERSFFAHAVPRPIYLIKGNKGSTTSGVQRYTNPGYAKIYKSGVLQRYTNPGYKDIQIRGTKISNLRGRQRVSNPAINPGYAKVSNPG